MRSVLKKLFVSGITIMFVHNVKAEDGSEKYQDYVITMQGDSLACYIYGPFYQTPAMKESERMKPDKIREYGEKNKYGDMVVCQSVYLDGATKPRFLALDERG